MRRQRRAGSRVLMALVFLFLYAPILLLIVFSFNKGNSNIVWTGFSLDWYKSLFQNRLIMRSVYTTLLVSLLATAIATIAGTFAAIGFYSLRRRTRTALSTVNSIPMMNADIVTGVAMCLFFVAFFTFWGDFSVWFNGVQSVVVLPERLPLGFGTLLIAHVTFNIPYVILSMGPKLRQMDKNLVDAAQDLGCTWMQAFWKVILPEIKPGIASGALTAFTMSVDDFIISYFTAGSSSSTLASASSCSPPASLTPFPASKRGFWLAHSSSTHLRVAASKSASGAAGGTYPGREASSTCAPWTSSGMDSHTGPGRPVVASCHARSRW